VLKPNFLAVKPQYAAGPPKLWRDMLLSDTISSTTKFDSMLARIVEDN